LAYQGYGHGLDLEVLKSISDFATGRLAPDMTLLLDLPVEIGLARRRRSDSDWNRLDALEVEFHHRVREGYLELARREPDRWIRIDAQREEEEVWAQIKTAVASRLKSGV
jgi:dTMP kinase